MQPRSELLDPLGPGGDRKYSSARIDPLTQARVDDAFGAAADDAILLADAVFLFRPELNDLWDFRIFVDIGFDLALKRGANRDREWEDSREAAEELYRTRYIPSERLYTCEVDPKRCADVIVDNRDLANPRRPPIRVEVRLAAEPRRSTKTTASRASRRSRARDSAPQGRASGGGAPSMTA